MIAIVVGLIGGTLSGLTGLGGGFIMVPLLVYLFGMSQHGAQGTSLAVLLPPLGLFAFLQYYRNGHVDVHVAILFAVGFLFGGWVGGYFAQLISGSLLRKGFAVVLALIACDMSFSPSQIASVTPRPISVSHRLTMNRCVMRSNRKPSLSICEPTCILCC